MILCLLLSKFSLFWKRPLASSHSAYVSVTFVLVAANAAAAAAGLQLPLDCEA